MLKIEKILNLGRKIIPKPIFKFFQPFYHKFLAIFAYFFYNFPSRKIKVIGVTGTKGKSTTCFLISEILEQAGFKTGLISGLYLKIGNKKQLSPFKNTMPGRFSIQKMLREMIKEKTDYAIIEITSEGLIQDRAWGIDFDLALFTNLSPEHIEHHGSFEKYKQAKGMLFRQLSKSKKRPRIIIANLDDENADYFLNFEADEKIGYIINSKCKVQNAKLNTIPSELNKTQNTKLENLKIIEANSCQFEKGKTRFVCQNTKFNINLLGEFNLYNALAALTIGISQKIDLEIIKNALEKIKNIPGKMEEINEEQNFKVIVDLAHTPESVEKLYKFYKENYPSSKIIAVFGSAGGGRDKKKRPILGKLASDYAQHIILTNEDPFYDDPLEIINQISQGIDKDKFKQEINFWKILDRKQAIEKAISLARENDIVLILGKGSEQTMVIKDKKIIWDDREVVKEILSQ